MSSVSYESMCRNCREEGNAYSTNRPLDLTWFSCSHCGLLISPSVGYLDLDGLNEIRVDQEMTLLSELPLQNKDLL